MYHVFRDRNVKLVFVKWKAFKQSAIVFFEVTFGLVKMSRQFPISGPTNPPPTYPTLLISWDSELSYTTTLSKVLRTLGGYTGFACKVFNRPGVAGAVLQTPPSLINRFIDSSFVEISSNHHNFQTVRARDLKF